MKKRYKILLLLNIGLLIILANIRWSTDIFYQNERYESNIRTCESNKINYKNPEGISTDTVIIDESSFRDFSEKKEYIINNLEAIKYLHSGAVQFHVIGYKYGNAVEYELNAFAGTYPDIVLFNKCYTESEIVEVNERYDRDILKYERKLAILKICNYLIIMIICVQVIVSIVLIITGLKKEH
jgi:hypothetical protein